MIDDVFAEMPHPNADAYAKKARSLMERGLFREAAGFAYYCAELSPHNQAGYTLLDEVLQHLDEATISEYRGKLASLRAKTQENPLYTYIQKLGYE